MTKTPRERFLIWTFALLGAGGLAYVFVAKLSMPLMDKRRTNLDLEGGNAALESDLDAMRRRNRAAMADILPRSLPADLDLGKREYESALGRLLRDAKVPAGFTVRDKAPDTKGIPELAKGRPAYTKIAYTITMAKVDIATLMAFLKKYYDLNLLHQITTFTLKREDTSSIAADKRPAKDRTDLNVTLITEALVLDGAPSRKTLLAAPVSAGAVFGGAGFHALENSSPELGRGIAPYMLGQILATPGRDYAYVTGRDVLHGPLPTPPPYVEPKKPPEVPPPPTGPDISPYIQLVTLVKSSDGTAHVEIFDKWNNLDFEINLKQRGESLTVDTMRYLKTKKSDAYPDGRIKDVTFPKGGGALVFADDKSSTKHTFKIYGVDGNALILGETDGPDAKPSGGSGRPGGKSPKPNADGKTALLGGVAAGVAAARGEKFYSWEAGVPLKGIKELKPDEAQRAIRRALGGLLEADAPAAPGPAIPAAVSLEVAPRPAPVTGGDR